MTHPYDITPVTCLDFPGRVACILWYAGCNLRCPYCYNPEIVFGKPGDMDEIAFLEERKDFLDGVVLSGGECTLNPDILSICQKIKSMGLDVKIDTNGSNPKVVKALLDSNLIDYVAIDNKMPSYKTWKLPCGRSLFDSFVECVKVLQESKIQYEIRTTIHPELLSEDDIVLYGENGQLAKYGASAIIGNENDFHIEVDGTEIGFYQAAQKVAYINGNKLYITQSVVLQQMGVGTPVSEGGLGQWSWKVHEVNDMNNLYLKWLG